MEQEDIEVSDVLEELVQATGIELDIDHEVIEAEKQHEQSDKVENIDHFDETIDETVTSGVTPETSPIKDISPAKLGNI